VTRLTKPLSRELDIPHLSRRPIIIGIDPEAKTIALHEKGCRTKYTIPIPTLYALLVKSWDAKQKAEKKGKA
jgi:hypothetical protein